MCGFCDEYYGVEDRAWNPWAKPDTDEALERADDLRERAEEEK